MSKSSLSSRRLQPLRRALLAVCAVCAFGANLPARAQMDGEVPFITSPDNVTQEMLRIANVGPSDHVIDLGSGDGRIVIVAARRFGATGLGVEIVPDLVQQSIRNARTAGVADKAEFREQDLFKTDLSRATVITMYLLPEVNLQLRPAVLRLKPGTRIVSHDWDMGDWQPDQTTVLPVPEKKVGIEKYSRVHLWTVPAQVDGLWCGPGGVQLHLAQRYQVFTGHLTQGDRIRAVVGNIQGASMQFAGGGQLALDASGQLRIGAGVAGVAPDVRLARAGGVRCPAP
jgi:hypothetical protein